MRFLQVVFLAIWQLTAVPFVALLTASMTKPALTHAVSENQTVIYKTIKQ
jgi:hypothetical protein